MGGFFLKTHYRSIGFYPEKAVHFSAIHQGIARSFAKGEAFLLYETKKGDRPGLMGAGAIWGVGYPLGKVVSIRPQEVCGMNYSLAVPVLVTSWLADRTRGVPAGRVQALLGRPLGFVGGVWELELQEYEILARELADCVAKEEQQYGGPGKWRMADQRGIG